MMMIIAGLFLAIFSVAGQAAVQSKAVEYKDGTPSLTGCLSWHDAADELHPGVLVIHKWWGLNDYIKKRVQMLAELDFVAFAADMYGDGPISDKPDEARTWMQEITTGVEGWRARALLGLDQLKASGMVDGDSLAAIGYCFGGAWHGFTNPDAGHYGILQYNQQADERSCRRFSARFLNSHLALVCRRAV